MPIRYADEVWTGVEYQVAGHLACEGMTAESLKLISAIRGGHDGRRRNPYNEIENGDHYCRAMAGWTILEASTRSSYNALGEQLRLGRDVTRYPLLAASGWAEVQARADQVQVRCLGGTMVIRSLLVSHGPAQNGAVPIRGVTVNGKPVPGFLDQARGEATFTRRSSWPGMRS